MELIVFLAVAFAVFVYVMVRGAMEQKRRKMKYRQYLKEAYGSFSKERYTPEELEKISCFYLRQHGECAVDDITWNDLNMDSIFALMNYTQSSSGEEYLYAMLRQPKLNDKENRLAAMEKHISYMMGHEKERLDTMMLLNELGRTGKHSLYDYMEYLGQLGVRSNAKHYICIVLLAAAIGVLFANTSLGVALLIAVICFNIITYMNEKGIASPYVTTFAYIMRMVNCADGIIKQEYSGGMEDYLLSLKKKRSQFKAFERNSGMVLKMNTSSGSMDEILFDYVKMLTHIDLIKFNKMLHIVQKNKKEIFDIVEDIGYLDAVISICYFRAALPWYCIPKLTEGMDVQFMITEGYHPAINNPVPNSFTQNRGMLITGSNASGKSTFLKMTAINAILAQTIHTCAAREYEGSYYRIYSSMALRDNLDNGESYYIVEIKALKRIMDAAAVRTSPLLCFVDEVLRGTNTVERIAASVQILQQLSHKGILCFAATHDIELTHLLEESYDNFHFEEEVQNGDVLFSYHLLEGRAHTRNAIKLLEIIGFSKEIIQRADEMAGQFLESGEWSATRISKSAENTD